MTVKIVTDSAADLPNERFRPRRVIVNYMGSTIGTYAGKGGLTVSFF